MFKRPIATQGTQENHKLLGIITFIQNAVDPLEQTKSITKSIMATQASHPDGHVGPEAQMAATQPSGDLGAPSADEMKLSDLCNQSK